MRLAFRVLRRASRLPALRRALWRRHAALARSAGLARFYLLLSFDCDTDRDIEVAPSVAERLRGLGIAATFAVPGEQLRRGRDTYRALAAGGHEFIAHGDHEHCVLREGEYISSFFYNQLDRDAVTQDIERSTATFGEIFGKPPAGFRVPHFGSFQGAEQLRFLHGVLTRYRYRFSSSTMPLYGFRFGPAVDTNGLREIPLSGCFSSPLSVLDSYGFRFAPGRRPRAESYERELTSTVGLFLDHGWPGLLNTYADPSQIHDFPPFWHAMEYVAKRGVQSLTYSRLLELVA